MSKQIKLEAHKIRYENHISYSIEIGDIRIEFGEKGVDELIAMLQKLKEVDEEDCK